MRQIGKIESPPEAALFVDYLMSQDIAAQTEESPEGWVIWIRDENDIESASEMLVAFRKDPADPLYKNASQEAAARRREIEEKQKIAQKNLVQVQGQWQSGHARKTPLVFMLIIASVGVTMLNNLKQGIPTGSNIWSITFMSEEALSEYHLQSQASGRGIDSLGEANPFTSIWEEKQLWRLVTPIFLHFGLMHLIFNMMWAWHLGAVIEDRIKTFRFALLVLALAIIPNCAQAIIATPNFGGFSGVGYGLFGYLWMKSHFDDAWTYRMPQSTIVLFLLWFFFCLSGWAGPVANWAHGVGLLTGVVIGYAPLFLRPLFNNRDAPPGRNRSDR